MQFSSLSFEREMFFGEKREIERYKCLLVCPSDATSKVLELGQFLGHSPLLWDTRLRCQLPNNILYSESESNHSSSWSKNRVFFKKMHSPYLTLGSCIFSGYLFASWKQRKCFQHTTASDFEIHPISIIAIN